MLEVWRVIKDFPDYAVSSIGRIKRITPNCGTQPGRILKPGFRRGYAYIYLCRRTAPKKFSVHRLVAQAFLGDIPNGLQCNHINGIKSDNRIENLEYVTSSRNQLHAIEHGLACPLPLPPPRRGEANNKCKITEELAQKILDSPINGYGYGVKLSKQFSVSINIVRQIKKRRTWKHLSTK